MVAQDQTTVPFIPLIDRYRLCALVHLGTRATTVQDSSQYCCRSLGILIWSRGIPFSSWRRPFEIRFEFRRSSSPQSQMSFLGQMLNRIIDTQIAAKPEAEVNLDPQWDFCREHLYLLNKGKVKITTRSSSLNWNRTCRNIFNVPKVLFERYSAPGLPSSKHYYITG